MVLLKRFPSELQNRNISAGVPSTLLLKIAGAGVHLHSRTIRSFSLSISAHHVGSTCWWDAFLCDRKSTMFQARHGLSFHDHREMMPERVAAGLWGRLNERQSHCLIRIAKLWGEHIGVRQTDAEIRGAMRGRPPRVQADSSSSWGNDRVRDAGFHNIGILFHRSAETLEP